MSTPNPQPETRPDRAKTPNEFNTILDTTFLEYRKCHDHLTQAEDKIQLLEREMQKLQTERDNAQEALHQNNIRLRELERRTVNSDLLEELLRVRGVLEGSQNEEAFLQRELQVKNRECEETKRALEEAQRELEQRRQTPPPPPPEAPTPTPSRGHRIRQPKKKSRKRDHSSRTRQERREAERREAERREADNMKMRATTFAYGVLRDITESTPKDLKKEINSLKSQALIAFEKMQECKAKHKDYFMDMM